MPSQGNPSELKSAVLFGVLYGVVLISVAASKEYLPHAGLYVIAALSGLADLDAITLSTARLVAAELRPIAYTVRDETSVRGTQH